MRSSNLCFEGTGVVACYKGVYRDHQHFRGMRGGNDWGDRLGVHLGGGGQCRDRHRGPAVRGPHPRSGGLGEGECRIDPSMP